MPSPLNTPTNERLPNQLWTIKRETDMTHMSGLDFTQNQTNDITIPDQISNSLIDTIDEETNQFTQRHPKCGDISESQPTDSRKVGRLSLNLDLNHDSCEGKSRNKPAINFATGLTDSTTPPQLIDVSIPLEKQGWFHGYISRTDAENVLRECKGGSYLVRRCPQSSKKHYSLSLKCVRGFMHIKIVEQSDGTYTFGTSSHSFTSIPQIVSHYGSNRLPIRGAEHMSLFYPVIDQLL